MLQASTEKAARGAEVAAAAAAAAAATATAELQAALHKAREENGVLTAALQTAAAATSSSPGGDASAGVDEVRFCRYRFCATGELKYRVRGRVRIQVHV